MRVAVISHTYVIRANRGKIRSLAGLPGLDVLLVTPRTWSSRDIGQHFRAATEEVGTLSMALPSAWSFGSGSLITYAPVTIWKLLQRWRPELVHLEEEPWSFAALELAWICGQLRIPLTFFTWENSNRALPLPLQLIQGSVLRRASAAVAGNAEAKVRLGRLGFGKRVVVLPQLGIDPNMFHPDQTGGDQSCKVVGFIGRLVPQKGLFQLVEAVARLSPDVRLMVVGNGPIKADLLERASLVGIQGRMEVHEGVSHGDVPRYLKQMSVLVLPSLSTLGWKEQFGHVLIEAMACRVPVIGSDSGAIPEVIGDAGVVVPEGNVGALAAAIDGLLADTAYRGELASRGEARVAAEYTDGVVAARLATFLRSVVEEAS